MLTLQIPGFKQMELAYLVCDFNGTLAKDGKLYQEVISLLNELSLDLKLYLLSADTYGNIQEESKKLNATVKIISAQNQDYTKQQFVKQLGSQQVIAIGNGRNDSMMLSEAALGIAVIEEEGCAVAAINSADIVVSGIKHALELLINPTRMIATLRS
ncbi:HAD family hydrolase [Bacteroidota bacterium]